MLHEVGRPGVSVIEFKNVTKRYGEKVAVDQMSLTVAAGSFFALLGPNGAGKTTSIRLMSTLTKPSSGAIAIGGCDVVTDAKRVRRQIGVVFQNHTLDDELTVAENLQVHALIQSMNMKNWTRRASELLELVGMSAREKHLVRGLSGGEKRRVEIARALMHRPAILFLDEPTVGLDTQVRTSVWLHLKQISRTEGVTVVFSTHYLEEAEANADAVALVNHGKLLACDTVQALSLLHGASGLTNVYLKLTGTEPG